MTFTLAASHWTGIAGTGVGKRKGGDVGSGSSQFRKCGMVDVNWIDAHVDSRRRCHISDDVDNVSGGSWPGCKPPINKCPRINSAGACNVPGAHAVAAPRNTARESLGMEIDAPWKVVRLGSRRYQGGMSLLHQE